MNLRLRISLKDLIKILFGKSVVILNRYDHHVPVRIMRGKDTYFTKE